MTDTNLPQGTGESEPLSVDEAESKISDLLADPETDLEEQDQETEADAEGAADDADEADAEDPDAEAEADEDEEGDGPGELKGGQFAPDTAKVTLKDGTVISVQDLKRGFISQQYFTRETQALSEEKKSVETTKAQIEEHARAIAAQRDFLLSAAQRFLPQPPDRAMMDSDPIGYMQAKAHYDEQMTIATQLHQARQAEQARMTEEQQRTQAQIRQQEAQKLFETMPELRKPESYQKFWSEAVETMSEYGFSQEELDQAADHRFYKVFRDLAKYRKARTQAPKVKEQIQQKPVLTGGKRLDRTTKISRERQAKREHLRNTGSFEASVSVLEDLIS